MPRYKVTLTEEEQNELESLIKKGGKGYRIKHAHILLKLNKCPENAEWNYERIMEAYGASRGTIAGVAKRFVMDGMEAALGRKAQQNRARKVIHYALYSVKSGIYHILLIIRGNNDR